MGPLQLAPKKTVWDDLSLQAPSSPAPTLRIAPPSSGPGLQLAPAVNLNQELSLGTPNVAPSTPAPTLGLEPNYGAATPPPTPVFTPGTD